MLLLSNALTIIIRWYNYTLLNLNNIIIRYINFLNDNLKLSCEKEPIGKEEKWGLQKVNVLVIEVINEQDNTHCVIICIQYIGDS